MKAKRLMTKILIDDNKHTHLKATCKSDNLLSCIFRIKASKSKPDNRGCDKGTRWPTRVT